MARKAKIYFDSVKSSAPTDQVANFFGFTESGESTIGEKLRKILRKREISSLFGVMLLFLGFSTLTVYATPNTGGSLEVNLNPPSPVIDATTKASAQKPIDYIYESRGFSWYHSGVDLVATTGTPVKPIMEGVVEAVNHDNYGYGNHVILTHSQGYESIYGHLSQTEVSVGQKVSLNTELGKSGSTGFSTGPHLHLEVHYNGQAINPADIVPGIN